MGTKNWDGTENMDYEFDDGGRTAAGFKGRTRDCVVRAVAIASGRSYAEIYAALSAGMGAQRNSKGRTARNGVNTNRQWFKKYMLGLGFIWVPTMRVGEGCKVHLLKNELPMGRLVVSLSKHYTACIDGVIRDIHNPTRATISMKDGLEIMVHRCVYGYWIKTVDAARYERMPQHDRRIARGDDFAGDAWRDTWTGEIVYGAVDVDRNRNAKCK